MKMHELVSWFQLEYPELVSEMKESCHHLTYFDKLKLGEASDLQDASGKYKGIYPSSKQAFNINPYHNEGSVFTHTMMVCKQAENAPYEVQIAALLHDIGKPSTRAVNLKNGRVSFYNHDAVSAFMSLEILKREELGLSKDQQVHIFNLIALHTQIYKLSVEQLSAIGNRELVGDLIQLGKADHGGRFHTAGDAVIPELLDIPSYSFYKEASMIKKEKEVIILCGLPGSGKSNWTAAQFLKKGSLFQVSRDECLMRLGSQHFQAKDFTYKEAWEAVDQKKVDKLLQESFKSAKDWGVLGEDTVVVDMTHMSKKSRRKSLSHFGSEYKKKCVVFLPDLAKNFLQNKERSGKVIDEAVINKMMRSFYPPTFEEFDEIEYVI